MASQASQDQVSCKAYDTFFGEKSVSEIVTQDQFSALMRKHELRLVGDTFQITDLEGQPFAATPIDSEETKAARQSERGSTGKQRSSITEEDPETSARIKINLAVQSLEALREHWDEPQIQLQEIMQIFVEQDNYCDFKQPEWSSFFGLLSQKLDLVNDKLCKSESDRYLFLQEAQLA